MKYFIRFVSVLSLVITGMSEGPAKAADAPLSAARQTGAAAPEWTGFYLGANLGGSWTESNSVAIATARGYINPTDVAFGGGPFAIATALGANGGLNVASRGLLGGGQIGFNLRLGERIFIGGETDFQGAAGDRASFTLGTLAPVAPFTTVDTIMQASRSLDWLGTTRGRLGLLLTPTLAAYGTGGFAYGGANASAGVVGTFNPLPALVSQPWIGSGVAARMRVGWTAGGGLEWMFLSNWSARIEYLHYDLGGADFNAGGLVSLNSPGLGGGAFFAHSPNVSTGFVGHVLRAGVSYHFNEAPAPAIANY